jgi:hypothetical protein
MPITVVPNFFEVGEHLLIKTNSWEHLMGYTNFWEHFYSVFGNNLRYIPNTCIFWEHLVDVLGALLVPGALVGKHWPIKS